MLQKSMESPNSSFERLSLTNEVRILEHKVEFFHRIAKLLQCLSQLAELAVPGLGDICKFLKDTYQLALADHEAAISTEIWQTEAFVGLFNTALELTFEHAEKLLTRHLKAKNKSGIANVLSMISGLPGSIDVSKVFFLSVLELLSEDYDDSLFESGDDPMVELLSVYVLQRGNLWKVSSCRTLGSRWLLYQCDQSCYQGDFYQNCFPGFYKSIMADVYHIHAVHRHCLQSQFPYSFLATASNVAQTLISALPRRRLNPTIFLDALQGFCDAREKVELEGFESASQVLTPAYVSFSSILQAVAQYFAREIGLNAQGDSAIHKLMWLYGNLSEFIYTFFSMHPEARPYLERLVSRYEVEWARESVVAAREIELSAIIHWLRYMRCNVLDRFHQSIRASVSKVCQSITATTYSQPAQTPHEQYVVQLIDLATAHYEQTGLAGRSNRVMMRKTLAVFCTVMFQEIRRCVKKTCREMSLAGVERLAKDISSLLDAMCGLALVRGKSGYVQKLRGLREIVKWRTVLQALVSDSDKDLSPKLLKWRERVTERRSGSVHYFGVSILQMQVVV